MCTRLEVDELCRFEPQVDLLLCAFYGVTAVNDVSAGGDKHVIPGKKTLSAEFSVRKNVGEASRAARLFRVQYSRSPSLRATKA